MAKSIALSNNQRVCNRQMVKRESMEQKWSSPIDKADICFHQITIHIIKSVQWYTTANDKKKSWTINVHPRRKRSQSSLQLNAITYQTTTQSADYQGLTVHLPRVSSLPQAQKLCPRPPAWILYKSHCFKQNGWSDQQSKWSFIHGRSTLRTTIHAAGQ